VLLAHTCNLSYSAGRDQQDPVLKVSQANTLSQKYPTDTRRRKGEQHQNQKKKKKERKKENTQCKKKG
jgi:hypothetical protein